MSTSTAPTFVPTGYGDEAKATALRAYNQIMARTAPTYLRPLAEGALAELAELDKFKALAQGTGDRPEGLTDAMLDRLADRTHGAVSMLAKVAISTLTNERPGAIAPCDYPGLLRAVIAVAIVGLDRPRLVQAPKCHGCQTRPSPAHVPYSSECLDAHAERALSIADR